MSSRHDVAAMIDMERRDDIDHAGGVNPSWPHRPNLLVFFPGALGDFLCFLPTLVGLRATIRGNLTLVAKPALLELIDLEDTTLISMDRAEVADLFGGPAEVAARTRALFGGFNLALSWTGAGAPGFAERLGRLGVGPVSVFPFRAMAPGEHAAEYYARCAGVPVGEIHATIRRDAAWFAGFAQLRSLSPRKFAVFHAGSGSRAKNWQGFDDLARLWGEAFAEIPILWLSGPVEEERGETLHPAYQVAGLSLPQVASLLENAGFFVGNDSGVSHLAGAVGTPGLALFGSTDPGIWRPRGGVEALRAPRPCPDHGSAVFCRHRLGPEEVFSAVRNRI